MSINSLPVPDRILHPQWSIEPHRVANEDAEIAAFDESIWRLEALPVTVGAGKVSSLNFSELQEPWGQVARWLAYCWINKPTPALLRDSPGSGHVDYPSRETIRQRTGGLVADIQWLSGEGVTDPSEIDDDHLTDLVLHFKEKQTSPGTIGRRLVVFRHWAAAADELPERLRLPADIDVNFPPGKRPHISAENRTRRIRQATMGPLLWWAIRLVDDYGDVSFNLFDLVLEPKVPLVPALGHRREHHAETGRFIRDTSGGALHSQARRLFDEAIMSGTPMPTWSSGSGEVALSYLEWLHGINCSSLWNAFREQAGEIKVAARADCPVINASEMPAGLPTIAQYYDLTCTEKRWPKLARLLQTACLINISYLTGMRPEEVRRLRSGCAEVIDLPGGGTRHLIRGTVTKRAQTADGMRAGTRVEEDAVWATIPAATRSVHLAERLRERFAPDSKWLFNNPHGSRSQGSLLGSSGAGTEIAVFIDAINNRDVEDAPDGFPLIPVDTHGRITLRRFRRTLAWHVRNQPHGEVTLGIQYQHVGTVVGSGYAAVGSTGWADVMDEEGFETRRQLANNLRAQFLDGAGISGPAAARAAGAIAEFDAAGASYMPESDMRRLLAAPGMTIYDNPSKMSLCVYDPDQAQCERVTGISGRMADPNLLGCRAGCSNRAMTDAQAETLESHATQTRMEAEAAPTPLKNRLLLAAQEMDERVTQHRQGRIVPTILQDEEIS